MVLSGCGTTKAKRRRGIVTSRPYVRCVKHLAVRPTACPIRGLRRMGRRRASDMGDGPDARYHLRGNGCPQSDDFSRGCWWGTRRGGALVGDRNVLQTCTVHKAAYCLKIGVPLPFWLQRVGGAVALGWRRLHPLFPSSVGAPRGGLLRLREADVVILAAPRRSATIDSKAGRVGNASPWVAIGGMEPSAAPDRVAYPRHRMSKLVLPPALSPQAQSRRDDLSPAVASQQCPQRRPRL